jgi:hypothetical protein
MSLFSDVDWTILLVAGGFLLLGGGNREALRTAGRLYGRILRLREEFLRQLREATTLTSPVPPAAEVSPGTAGNSSLSVLPPLPGVPATSRWTSVADGWTLGEGHGGERRGDPFWGRPN